jgi:hypothetical protein
MNSLLKWTLLFGVLIQISTNSDVTYTDSCQQILSSVEKRKADDSRTFVYQCRPYEDCGGIADRMAGIMSGVFFALLSDRAFKVHWPGFDHVFEPQTVQWSFDEHSYDIPANELYHNGLVDTYEIGAGRLTLPFPSSSVSAIFDDRNSHEINNPAKWLQLVPFQHIFYHSNRDPMLETYQRVVEKHHWPADDGDAHHGYYVAYRCLFNDVFTPAAAFFNAAYKPLDKDEMPFHDIISVLEDFDHVSLAYHHRIPDHQLATDPEEARIADSEIEWLVNFAEQHYALSDQKMNLFFVTNSINSARKVAAHPGIRNIYEHVYSQDLTGGVHINYEKSSPGEAFRQAMMDWWVMRQAHYLVCGGSGFCNMAAAVADEAQVRIDNNTKKRVELGAVLITTRTCEAGCYEVEG